MIVFPESSTEIQEVKVGMKGITRDYPWNFWPASWIFCKYLENPAGGAHHSSKNTVWPERCKWEVRSVLCVWPTVHKALVLGGSKSSGVAQTTNWLQQCHGFRNRKSHHMAFCKPLIDPNNGCAYCWWIIVYSDCKAWTAEVTFKCYFCYLKYVMRTPCTLWQVFLKAEILEHIAENCITFPTGYSSQFTLYPSDTLFHIYPRKKKITPGKNPK